MVWQPLVSAEILLWTRALPAWRCVCRSARRATLAGPPGSGAGVRIALRALGASTRVQWLLDGRWIGETEAARQLVHVFDTPGAHELTALADSGAWHAVRFRVIVPGR